jgi:ABC-type phosphate/phosphonate transport system substrate-binding protein
MIAALPMYDFAPVRDATDAWWQGLAKAFRHQGIAEVPEQLTRDHAERAWRRPDLLIAQVCGYPLVRFRGAKPKLIATPCYQAPGCEGPDYCSLIIVHEQETANSLEDLRGRVLAVNGRDSHSGYHALQAMVAPLATPGGRFFGSQIITGSHAGSLEAIEAGEADVAAIDTVTYTLIRRYLPDALDSFRILGRSPRAPGPPYVTVASAADELVERMRDALVDALSDPDLATCRDDLLIAGAKLVGLDGYGRIDEMARIGERIGVPDGSQSGGGRVVAGNFEH